MRKSPEKEQAPLEYPVDRPSTLLAFLLEHVRGKSRNNVKSMLSRGQVKVDGRGTTRFDEPLAPGQTVTVSRYVSASPALPFPILFEDGELIVIDKPAGLLSVATEKKEAATAYRMLSDYLGGDAPGERIHVVHRLDRDTSGVLLFAKNRALKLALQENWNSLVKKRGYLAVVEGAVEQKSGTIRSSLHETRTHLVYSGAPRGGGKEAVTRYHVVREGRGYSLLDVEIDTGRKNQIRAHMKEMGHPVAGDRLYGAASDPLGRLGLHASELTLVHPSSGETLHFTAGTPAAFGRLFRQP
jgi:23S rRNA pseudouridine1911/1915/1917 synthase